MKINYGTDEKVHVFHHLKSGQMFRNSFGQGLFVKSGTTSSLIIESPNDMKEDVGRSCSWDLSDRITPVVRIDVYTE